MDLYELPDYDAHELVLFGHDSATGLRSIIALHSSALGPAAGGCRLWAYRTTAEAVADALRLSRGMSYKNAMAGLRFGGGKAVILAATRQMKTPELFEAFGRFVDSLGGRYVTAEDVGTTIEERPSGFFSGSRPRCASGSAGPISRA